MVKEIIKYIKMLIQKLKSLKNQKGFMKYFKNTSWLFAEKVLRMIVGLFVGIWIARYLGPEQFGLFSYAQSFVGLFTAIATLGLDGIVIRELVRDESKRDVLLGTAFRLKLVGALLVLLFLAVAVNFTSNDHYTNMLIYIIASATIFQSLNVIDMYFQSKVLSKYVVYSNIISLFISTMIKITLLLNEAALIAFVWVVLFDSIVLALGLLYFYLYNHLSLKSWKFEKGMAQILLKNSWPLIFGSIAATLYMKIDQVMIKEMLGSEAVGYYVVAVKLSEVWLIITIVLTQSFAPSIINAKKNNNKLYLERVQAIYNLLIKISVFISIIIFVFSKDIITLLYGKEYTSSIEILNIYIWSIVFVFLSNGSWAYYLNENLQKLASMRLIYGAFINIVLNIYFIEYFGLVGAAYSTLISYSISSYFVNFFYKKTRLNFMLQTKSIINIFNINTWLHPIEPKNKR
ncbi:flippase [Sulfurovum sp. XTW-4]|uniref:Flippase n=1 Tax=Sulfurovum xiamenensis TaxID=3019066 RepID=A0ABT7QRR6_9BACT|nr:flippase [Sulfurovum xiamenensis]MDM5263705.1 flippase [Sulfurovum xiamenensis]